jgi:hypothetical protein
MLDQLEDVLVFLLFEFGAVLLIEQGPVLFREGGRFA